MGVGMAWWRLRVRLATGVRDLLVFGEGAVAAVVLAAAHRDADAAGGWMRMAALSQPVRRVVEIVGLDTIITCCPTLAQALKP
ncbi:hypothetical protein OG788_45735 [Streptomyces sp. NBC_00647]|uniref:hypothetical protein n=1 Tax=Streptomyces sp. NBC_00647 TaxID=2975796 RepID=UPI003247B9EA